MHEASDRNCHATFLTKRIKLFVNIIFFNFGYLGLEDKSNFGKVNKFCFIKDQIYILLFPFYNTYLEQVVLQLKVREILREIYIPMF